MNYKLSLTDFVDIVSKSGTQKYNKVKKVLSREPYHPNFDYYKILREGIVKFHILRKTTKYFENILKQVSTTDKYENYDDIIRNYISWCGHKKTKYFKPPSNIYSYMNIDLIINPELGLSISKKKFLIKLYFKSDPLSKHKIDIITHLMKISLSSSVSKDTKMAVLDIRSKKFITPTVPIPEMTAILRAEIAYISEIARTLR